MKRHWMKRLFSIILARPIIIKVNEAFPSILQSSFIVRRWRELGQQRHQHQDAARESSFSHLVIYLLPFKKTEQDGGIKEGLSSEFILFMLLPRIFYSLVKLLTVSHEIWNKSIDNETDAGRAASRGIFESDLGRLHNACSNEIPIPNQPEECFYFIAPKVRSEKKIVRMAKKADQRVGDVHKLRFFVHHITLLVDAAIHTKRVFIECHINFYAVIYDFIEHWQFAESEKGRRRSEEA
jgi:hypothetical protein